MSAEPLARLLTDFDGANREKTRDWVVPFERKLNTVAVARAEELTAKTEEAYQRGKSEAQAAALAEQESKLAQEKVRYAIKLAQERERWANEQGATIAAGIADACRNLETEIAAAVARILEPFLSTAITQQAVAAFVDQLAVVAADPSRPVLRVTGPGDLLDAVRRKMGSPTVTIEYRVSEGAEIRAVVDQTVIETQLSAWARRLQDAVS